MACLFHKWNGGICAKCGKTRDDAHAYESIPDKPPTPPVPIAVTGFAVALEALAENAFIFFVAETDSNSVDTFACIGLYADGTFIYAYIKAICELEAFHSVAKWFNRHNSLQIKNTYKIEGSKLFTTTEKPILNYSGSVEADGMLFLDWYIYLTKEQGKERYVPVGIVKDGILDVYEDFDMSKIFI